MSIHHFTINYDTSTMKWAVDEQGDKPIYLPEQDEWIAPNTNSNDILVQAISRLDTNALNVLTHTIKLLNQLGDR